jgi:hypothetical protein
VERNEEHIYDFRPPSLNEKKIEGWIRAMRERGVEDEEIMGTMKLILSISNISSGMKTINSETRKENQLRFMT